MKLEWVKVENGMIRASIPGGWLVRQYESHYDTGMARWEEEIVSICFVPDPNHVWDVSGEEDKV